jgi:hypothetical protein
MSSNDPGIRATDLKIALRVTGLPCAGWYRRVSMKTTDKIRVEGPDDVVTDGPMKITPSVYYLTRGHVATDGTVEGDTFAIPYYTQDWNAAMAVRDALVDQDRGPEFERVLAYGAGGWLLATPADVCRAALAVVEGEEGDSVDRGWDEAGARRLAFISAKDASKEDVLDHLTRSLVACDRERKRADREGLRLEEALEELEKARRVIADGGIPTLAYDHLHQAVRALVGEYKNASESATREGHWRMRLLQCLDGISTLTDEIFGSLDYEGPAPHLTIKLKAPLRAIREEVARGREHEGRPGDKGYVGGVSFPQGMPEDLKAEGGWEVDESVLAEGQVNISGDSEYVKRQNREVLMRFIYALKAEPDLAAEFRQVLAEGLDP